MASRPAMRKNAISIWGLIAAAANLAALGCGRRDFLIGLSRSCWQSTFPPTCCRLDDRRSGARVRSALGDAGPALGHRHTLAAENRAGLCRLVACSCYRLAGLPLCSSHRPARNGPRWAAQAYPPENGELAIDLRDVAVRRGRRRLFRHHGRPGAAAHRPTLRARTVVEAPVALSCWAPSEWRSLWMGLRMVLPRDASLMAQVFALTYSYASLALDRLRARRWLFLKLKL